MKKLKCCGVIIGIIMFIVLAVGSLDSDESSNTVKNKSIIKKTTEPNIKITAKELSNAFEQNEIKANKEYRNKYAEIKGSVSSIGEIFGSTYICLKGDGLLTDVKCYFDDQTEIDKIENISKNDIVTIVGKIDGMDISVTVNQCKFK